MSLRPYCLMAVVTSVLASAALAQTASPTAPITPEPAAQAPLALPGLPVVPAEPAAPVAAPTPAAPPVAPAPVPEAVIVPVPVPEVPALPSVPQTPITADPTPTAPVLGDVAITPDAEFSYGSIPYSLMFTPDQVMNMKNALATYETLRRTKGSAAADIVIEEATAADTAQAQPIAEPLSYPVFTLSSIVYRDAKDWMVWIGGIRITPKTNDREIKVVSVSPTAARFVWKPIYMDFLIRRQQENKLASTDALKNKLTNPTTAMLDAQARQVTFTLKPNQSFSAGHMATFEGRVNPPTMEALPAANADGMGAAGAPAAPAATTDVTPSSGLGQGAINRMYDKAATQQQLSAPNAAVVQPRSASAPAQ